MISTVSPARATSDPGGGTAGECRLPHPIPKKHRLSTVWAEDKPSRPLRADAHAEKARADFGAFERRNVCRLYYNLEKIPRETGGPIGKNPEFSAANADGPARKIVAALCGVGRTEVGKYLGKGEEGGGVLRSAFPRGPAEKDQREIALMSAMHAGETLYDAILGRVASVHREGRVNKARNLMRYLTVGADGARLRGPRTRFPEEARQDGAVLRQGEKVLAAERSKPYIRRWWVSYCRRRVYQLENGQPKRPRVWMDATFVNKWTTWG